MRINRVKFFEELRHTGLFNGHLTQSQVDGLNRLLDAWERYCQSWPLDELSYDLSTSYWETGETMQPIHERGGRSYFNKYEPGTRIGRNLGNTVPGDGYRFRGEGDVQNTGRANARKSSAKLNELFGLNTDFINHPEQRGDPLYSALCLFVGNHEGWWTGKPLSAYLDGKDEGDAEDLREFILARHVVNGTDKAETIGKNAILFEHVVRASVEEGPPAAPVPVILAHEDTPATPGGTPDPAPGSGNGGKTLAAAALIAAGAAWTYFSGVACSLPLISNLCGG